MVATEIGGKVANVHVTWDSVAEVFADCQEQAANPTNKNRRSARDAQRKWSEDAATSRAARGWGAEWAEHKYAADMAQLLDKPEEDLLAQVEAMCSRIVDGLPTLRNDKVRRRRMRGQEWGDEIDVDRYARRDPLMWERMDRLPQPSKTIRIAVEFTIECSARRATLLPRGAALLALADWLTRNGYSVEVWGTWYLRSWLANDPRSTAVGAVRVKPANMPLDIGGLATALCEVAYARMLPLCGMVFHTPAEVRVGWGHVGEMPGSVQQMLGYDVTASARIRCEEDAALWVAQVVERLGSGEGTSAGEDAWRLD